MNPMWEARVALARKELQDRMKDVDPRLVHEMIGFFMGEGSIFMAIENISKTGITNHTYRPALSINIRLDDAPILEAFFKVFGGTKLSSWKMKEHDGYTSNPQIRWAVQGYPRVYAVLEVLEQGFLPSKKKAEILLAKEACEVRFSYGGHVNPELRERLKQYYLGLKELKKYPS